MPLKHGLSQSPEYKCWQQIKARCLNPRHAAYPNYGGRGITIYDGWAHNFVAFYEHVGPRPSSKHSLDRLRNEEGYVPGNVAWRTWIEQARNRRPHGTAEGVRPPRVPGRVTNFKHGRINTPEYGAWGSMKNRCLNPANANYPEWGGRGIEVHPPWIDDFLLFYRDVGPRPSPEHSLDRIDNNGGYEPGNVRWATKREQRHNQRPYRTGPTHGNYDHGGSKTPTYKVWGAIKTRCFNPKHDGYARYGALGITTCQRWREDFEAFVADLGTKPSDCNLLRLNHDGHYSCGKCPECLAKGWPANCRWATSTEINRSRRSSNRSGKLTMADAQRIRQHLAAGATQPEVAKAFGVGRSLVGKIWRGENWV